MIKRESKKRRVNVALLTVAVLAVTATVTNADIVAYWPFDEGTGDVARDFVGGFDAQLTNIEWVADQCNGSALYSDRNGDEILVGSGPTPTTQDLSFAFWMVDNYESNQTMMNKYEFESTAGYGILLRPEVEESPLRFRIGGWNPGAYYGGWDSECRVPQGAYSDGEWVHVACTYDYASDTATIYINGDLAANGDYNPKTGIAGPGGYCDGVNDPTQPLYIVGQRETYGGIVDEVAIWDHALTAGEVLDVYLFGPTLLVEIDIKPGNNLNSINLGSKGMVPVAILSSEAFDATTVNPDTVELAGSGVGVRGKSDKLMAHEEDVNGDGLLDLVCQVEIENLVASNFQDGYAILTGETYNCVSIAGEDEIIIVPPSGNLVNGGFENGVLEPWGFWGDATAEVVTELVGAAVPEAPIEGDFSLHITVNSAGTHDWDYGLNQGGFVFRKGRKYTLSAFLKCKEGTMDIRFKPELAQDPWTGYGEHSFTMTEEWAEYSVTTPVFAKNVSPAEITFHIAFAAGEFWMDGVRFYEGEPDSTGPTEVIDVIGDFEGSLDGWWAEDATLSLSLTGATTGTEALQVDGPGGWHLNSMVDIKPHRASLGITGAMITADVTAFDADMTTTWMQVEMVINAQNNDDNGANNNIGWQELGFEDVTRDGQPHTYTWVLSETLTSAIAGVDDNISWFELALVTNLDGASVTKFYIDNIQLIYEVP